jgi:predicted transglutaminase-like cysteine proteinase
MHLRMSSALLAACAILGAPVEAAEAPGRNIANASSLLPPGPDMLGTHAVPIQAVRFSAYLERAREDASSSPLLQQLIAPARSLSTLQKIAFVQRAVMARIRWISDATEWGQHEYWASALQTLARGAGDSQDRAIVKLQALRALGFNNSDLFLTLARDRVSGPLTVVTVRNGGHYYVLDDTGGDPYQVEQRSFEFEPIMSFGMYGAWLHVRSAVGKAGVSTTLAGTASSVSSAGHK